MKLKFPHYLLIVYLIVFVLLGISPKDRITWIVENSVIVVLVLGLTLSYRKFKFSNLSYFLMFVFIIIHTIGGHYTFAEVPFDLINNFFGFERNNFDRFAHFGVGVFSYAIAEVLLRGKKINSKIIILLFAFFSMVAWSAFYEISEWIYAVVSNPELGLAFLGSQGDIWDAQKDMALDALGSLCFTSLFYFINKKKLKNN